MALDKLGKELDALLGEGRVVRGNKIPESKRTPKEPLPYSAGDSIGNISARKVETASGAVLLHEELFPASHIHGEVPLDRFSSLEGLGNVLPTNAPPLPDLEKVIFLDTETTGISRKSMAFMVGIGRWVPEGGFRVAQLFLPAPPDEGALLETLNSECEGAMHLVTYNGKTFDMPLLEGRYTINGVTSPFKSMPHLDLLPLARRLWKRGAGSGKLQAMEAKVLSYHREGDIPGAEIPAEYARYLATGEAGRLPAVFTHNALDILSLGALLAAAAEVGREVTPRIKAEPVTREELIRAADAATDSYEKKKHLRKLAMVYKRAEEFDALLNVTAKMREEDRCDPWPVIEALKVLEHKAQDYLTGSEIAKEALELGFWHPDDREAIEKRLARLAKKAGE
ncbi:MAG: hypothetical protein C0609_05280 [Deltaproteobacteria bacterium]|nr:MAG: hypothetical protein C0609_05280 [Deltaproteobacteria bacterium]